MQMYAVIRRSAGHIVSRQCPWRVRLETNVIYARISTLSFQCLSVGAPHQTTGHHPSSKLWSLGRLNHVAIAVPDLEAATRLYRDVLGATVSEVMVYITQHTL